MSKINGITMHRDEMKVLDVLEQHAKENVSELGKRCGFSPQKVARIIKNLETMKLIWGYSAITGADEKGIKHFVLLIQRNTVPFEASFKKEVVIEKLDDYAPDSVKIEDIYFTDGTYNAVITFYAPDIMNAKKFVNECFRRLGKYFGEYHLLDTLIPVRKQGLKNPQIKNLVEFL